MKVGESTGTGSGGARAVAAAASDRCTGSGGRPGVGGGWARSKTNEPFGVKVVHVRQNQFGENRD